MTEVVKIPNRGHSLTIDHGWREVAETALNFVKRFAKSLGSGSALLRMPQSNPGSQHTAGYDCGRTLITGGRGGHMKPKIVVIGGSGLIGAMVVEKLKQKGNDAVAAPPDTAVYTMSGEGSDGALAGAEVVVDVASAPSFEDQAAWDFFQIVGENLAAAEVADAINFFRTAHENLAAAELAAGVKHHVALSVVGTERLQDLAYFRAKLMQENMIKGSPVPHTIIRASLFFEWIRPIAQAGTDGDTVRVSHSLFHPVAADDVASAVAEVALDAPRNGTVEVAGPDKFYVDELVAKVLEHDKDPRNVIMGDPGGLFYGIQLDDQSLMPGRDARLGPTTVDWWLTH